MESIIKRNTFSILLFIRRNKTNKNGEHPIYAKLTIQGKSREFSTQIWVKDNKWNPSSSKVIGTNEVAKSANHSLEVIKNNLINIRAELQKEGKSVTPEVVINRHLGKTEKKYTLLEIHKFHNENHVKNLIGKDYALGTYERYKTSYEHVKKFIKQKYRVDDISLNEITFSFASDYEFYLKTERECANNTTVKYIKNLKSVLNFAVGKEWISNNPISRYKGKLDRIEKEYLTQEEIRTIQNKVISNERIREVRDVFIFCCYTGLAYSDVAKLKKDDIIVGINGGKQINIRRTKTDVMSNIPLLDQAKDILEIYREHPICQYNNTLLPVKSNQKQNAYLKEIADICGINKKLTTHTARHTFATLMLTKKISIESVSSMLGHTNIQTTQIYAKIIAEKVVNEMEEVNEIFKKENLKYTKINAS